jgi:hypothetical protein
VLPDESVESLDVLRVLLRHVLDRGVTVRALADAAGRKPAVVSRVVRDPQAPGARGASRSLQLDLLKAAESLLRFLHHSPAPRRRPGPRRDAPRVDEHSLILRAAHGGLSPYAAACEVIDADMESGARKTGSRHAGRSAVKTLLRRVERRQAAGQLIPLATRLPDHRAWTPVGDDATPLPRSLTERIRAFQARAIRRPAPQSAAVPGTGS